VPILIGTVHAMILRLDPDLARELREMWRSSESLLLADMADTLGLVHGDWEKSGPEFSVIEGGRRAPDEDPSA
jgi:hypothetical protein